MISRVSMVDSSGFNFDLMLPIIEFLARLQRYAVSVPITAKLVGKYACLKHLKDSVMGYLFNRFQVGYNMG